METLDEIIGPYIGTKISESISVLQNCVGTKGVWASATRSQTEYGNINFTRDMAIGIEGLHIAGLDDAVARHIENLSQRQGKTGNIGDFFPDNNFAYAKDKIRKLITKDGRWMIAKKLNKWVKIPHPNIYKALDAVDFGVLDFFALDTMGATHNTTDSPLFYINAVMDHARLTNNPAFSEKYRASMGHALQFSRGRINEEGLYTGSDWRDNVRFSDGATLLSNNVLLYSTLKLLGYNREADILRDNIRSKFWNGEFYTDQPGDSHFDAFGQSLTVLNDIATPDQYASISRKLEDLITPFGIRVNDLVAPEMSGEEQMSVAQVNQYGNTTWPVFTGYAILALDKMEKHKEARDLFYRWTMLGGFREWHDATNGVGGGAEKQMWSAALYLTVAKRLGYKLAA